jgi:hypothetical protein
MCEEIVEYLPIPDGPFNVFDPWLKHQGFNVGISVIQIRNDGALAPCYLVAALGLLEGRGPFSDRGWPSNSVKMPDLWENVGWSDIARYEAYHR